MYAFAYLEESGIDYSYQVMVYDSTRKAYEDMMLALPGLFESFGCIDEYPAYGLLKEMAAQCRCFAIAETSSLLLSISSKE